MSTQTIQPPDPVQESYTHTQRRVHNFTHNLRSCTQERHSPVSTHNSNACLHKQLNHQIQYKSPTLTHRKEYTTSRTTQEAAHRNDTARLVLTTQTHVYTNNSTTRSSTRVLHSHTEESTQLHAQPKKLHTGTTQPG